MLPNIVKGKNYSFLAWSRLVIDKKARQKNNNKKLKPKLKKKNSTSCGLIKGNCVCIAEIAECVELEGVHKKSGGTKKKTIAEGLCWRKLAQKRVGWFYFNEMHNSID